jgi:hypothetical protein
VVGVQIQSNSFGKSNDLTSQTAILMQMDDGDPAGPVLDSRGHRSIVSGNWTFGALEGVLTITGITRGATTVVAYTKATGTAHPLTGDFIWPKSIGGTTELNTKLYKVGTVVETSATVGTVELVNAESGAALDSSGFGAWTSGGTLEKSNAFLINLSGARLLVNDNMMPLKSLGVYVGVNTSDVYGIGNYVPDGTISQSVSSSPGTINITAVA